MGKYANAETNQRKIDETILISSKLDFKKRNIMRKRSTFHKLKITRET